MAFAEETVTCPQAHTVPADEVIIRTNTRVCPECDGARPWE